MSVADTSPPLATTLQECINRCPSIGFVVTGNTTERLKQGTVTTFERKDGKVWALTESYGQGKPPHAVWNVGERELTGILTETILRLHNECTMTWKAWDYEYPLGDNDQDHPHKTFMCMVFNGRNGPVARIPRVPSYLLP